MLENVSKYLRDQICRFICVPNGDTRTTKHHEIVQRSAHSFEYGGVMLWGDGGSI